jgi:diadenosine tetraphosphatase ApaH/serine/threonine PP2A family protein phosphatase
MLVDLAEDAKIVEPATFLALVKRSLFLLRKEQRDLKTKRDNGRLLRLPSSGTAIIVGDLHGDLASLMYILKSSDFVRRAQLCKDVHLIFLGDYGDRGLASPEVYYIILKLKQLFPEKVVLMRGNHESPEDMLPDPYDLPVQFNQKFGEEAGEILVTELRKFFKHLYNAVIIEERAILIHGGAPSKAESLRDLTNAHKKHPKESHLEEMLWSDPKENLKGTQPSPRGAGYLFGSDVTKKLLRLLSVKVLIRGHEFCQEGFKINHNNKVLTLFSTNKPPYTNQYAAYLKFDLSTEIKNIDDLRKCIKQFE